MTIRVIREGSAPHDARLRVRDVIAALVELGDPDLTVGIRYDRDGNGDATYPAVSVLLDEDESSGTWVVLE